MLCWAVLALSVPVTQEQRRSLLSKYEQCTDSLYYPKQYIAYFTPKPLVLDGKVDDPLWNEVGCTEDFVDISTLTVPRFRTCAKIRWDNEFLYIGARLEEPELWANLTQHNDVIYHDNDFEVFVDSDGSTHNYKEFEINQFNTTWDLLLNKPYDDNGFENSTRVFPNGWEMQPPLYSRVHVNGTINDPSKATPNSYWSVEIALPLEQLVEGKSSNVPPQSGDLWRINFSRVEWRVKVVNGKYQKDLDYPHEDNWVWSPQGAIAMHLPEKWGFLQFSKDRINSTRPTRSPDWAVRSVAMDLYYAEHTYFAQNKEFTNRIDLLAPLAPSGLLDGRCSQLPTVSLVGQGFVGVVPGNVEEGDRYLAMIRDDRYLTVTTF